MTESPARGHDFAVDYAEEDMGRASAPFTQWSAPDGHGVVVEGDCPRCHGRTRTEYRHGVPGTGTKGLRSWLTGRHPVPAEDAHALLDEVHFCECGHPHPNLPPDAPFTGCGASWRVRALVPGEAA
ncbi:hypothetical protein ACGFNV_26205 [Streptomyces sp. NPDC048751]|uniref:hypothetical protein n=1 Tax=Streptomyces sp. NPDC048751 TaxID=3365591 RepID=UPI003715D408